MLRKKSRKKGEAPKVQKRCRKASPNKTAMKASKGGGVKFKATDEVSLTLTLKAEGEDVLEIPFKKVPKGLVGMLRKLRNIPTDKVKLPLRSLISILLKEGMIRC